MPRGRFGFTLLESLLAIVIISVMVAAAAFIMVKGMESYSLIVDRREALQGARLAVNMMESELQTIAAPATDITAISATAITFRNATGQTVTYSISGSNLLRGAKTLASNIVAANSGFLFYTAGGGTTTTPSQVHRIHLQVEVDTGSAAHGKVQINDNAYLRNRYYSAFTQN